MPRVDVIVAVRDEELTLPGFVRSIRSLVVPKDVEIGFVFVEDSSTDNTRATLANLAAGDPLISYYCLARGYGQGPAIVFGMSKSAADAMVMLDVDGSHPVEVIPDMIERFQSGASIVQCRRRELTGRQTHRRVGTWAYHLLARVLTGRDPAEQAIYYRLVSAQVSLRILASPRTWHYLRFPLRAFAAAGRVDVVDVDMRERTLGKSKYGVFRLIDLVFLGILTQVSEVRLVVLCGALAAIGGVCALLGAGSVAILPICVAGYLVARYWALGKSDVMSSMNAATLTATVT